MTSTTVRSYRVALTVEGTVLAENASAAVQELTQQVRDGLGPDNGKRKNAAVIVHGEATCKSVFIPEKGSKSE